MEEDGNLIGRLHGETVSRLAKMEYKHLLFQPSLGMRALDWLSPNINMLLDRIYAIRVVLGKVTGQPWQLCSG